MTLYEFADAIMKDLQIMRYNDAPASEKFCANFVNCAVKESSALRHVFGRGPTPEDAVRDYSTLISGQILIFNVGTNEPRQEYKVPALDFV
jgi:hypothetical protein